MTLFGKSHKCSPNILNLPLNREAVQTLGENYPVLPSGSNNGPLQRVNFPNRKDILHITKHTVNQQVKINTQ